MEGDGGLADDLFGEFNGHVVSVVGGLDDATDDESWCDFGQH